MKIHASTTIDRPIEEVFAFVSDPLNDPRWCTYVKSVEQTAGQGPAVGARYRVMHDPRPGKAVPFEVELLEVEAPRRMVLVEEDFAVVIRVTYDLTAIGDGRTEMAQTSDFSLKGAWKLMLPASYIGIRTTLPKQFAALKAVLESTADTPRQG